MTNIGKILYFDDFSEERECLFGVVASEVIDLRDDLFGVEGQQLLEEKSGVVLVGLPQSR